mgnify:CR=1 FL=1
MNSLFLFVLLFEVYVLPRVEVYFNLGYIGLFLIPLTLTLCLMLNRVLVFKRLYLYYRFRRRKSNLSGGCNKYTP